MKEKALTLPATMPKKRFDLIVFDWDGTLMDSTSTIALCIQAAARDLGLPVPDTRSASYVIGLGLQDAMRAVLPGLESRYYPLIIERYKHHYLAKDAGLCLFEGVRDMLEDLSRRGYFLAVATGKSRVGLNRALDVVGLLSMFDATRCADETFSKPHPAMLNEIARELGQDIGRIVMIGDTTHDLQMARNAGAAGIAVHYGAHDKPELEALDPVFSASSVSELHGWLVEHA